MRYFKFTLLLASLFVLLCCQNESIVSSLSKKDSSKITRHEIKRLFEVVDCNQMVNNIEYSEVINELVFKSLNGNPQGFVYVYSLFLNRKSSVCESIDGILQNPLCDDGPYWDIESIREKVNSLNEENPAILRILIDLRNL